MMHHDPRLFQVGRDREGFVKPLADDAHPDKGDLPSFWYIFRTFPNAEESVIEDFDDLGVHWFRAMNKEERKIRASRRCANPKKRFVETPMYPGYLFANVASDRAWPDLSGVDGLAAILRMASGSLAVIPHADIEVLQDEIARGEHDGAKRLRRLFEPGDKVKIIEGPFIGFPGTVTRALSGQPAEILVDIFGRQTPLSIENDWFEAAA